MREGGRLNTLEFQILMPGEEYSVKSDHRNNNQWLFLPCESVLRWYSNSRAIFTAHKFDLWKLLLGLAKIIRIDKKLTCLVKRQFPKKASAINWPFYRAWLWNRTFTTGTRFQWENILISTGCKISFWSSHSELGLVLHWHNFDVLLYWGKT